MPLQKLQLRPGVNRESTSLANEGTWFEMDKVRFRSGFPEKIGGWVQDTGTQSDGLLPPTGSFWGTCRSLWNWVTLNGYNLMGLGTHLKYYIQSSSNGEFYDVTPLRDTNTIASNAFTTVNGSTTVVINDPGYGAANGDFVTISGATGTAGLINGIPEASFNKEFRVNYIDASTYSITVSTAATSSGTTGAATFAYQISIGQEIYSTLTGFGAGGWGGAIAIAATTTLNGALNSSATTITVVSTTGFAATGSIGIGGEYITYSGKTSTTFTGCTRGVGSTAVAHSSGATVNQYSGATGWGESATSGVDVQLRLWSQSNYGQDLIINPRGGALYLWKVSPSTSTYDRAVLLSPTSPGDYQTDANCPTIANGVTVSDASRFVIAFGCNDYGLATQDPLLVRWSDQEDYATWSPAATNQAGSYRLSTGSSIVAYQQTRQEILVWTDAAVYSMQYLGPPYVWGFQILGYNTSIAGPNATTTASNISYWMGLDKFYMYSGRVETLYCPLRQYVFGNINLEQEYQIFASTNEGYNEIWWFYCSITGPNGTGTPLNPNTTVDRYVIYNHLERIWSYGNLGRTAWLDTPLRDYPVATDYKNLLIYHENGVDDGTTNPPSAMPAYIQSADFNIGDGHNYGFAWRMIPDITFDGSYANKPSVTFTLRPRQNPGSDYNTADTPTVASTQNYQNQRNYNVQQFTQIIYTRIRGRQMAFKVSSNGLGVNWQLGVPSFDVRPDGRR